MISVNLGKLSQAAILAFGWVANSFLTSPSNGWGQADETPVPRVGQWVSAPSTAPNAPPKVQVNLLEVRSSHDARQRLTTPIRFYWDQQPLREGLAAVASASGVAIWIDRRVDPNQAVTFGAEDSTTPRQWPAGSLGERLDEIAERLELDFGLIESVLYIGPRGQTARLQRAAVALHDELHRLAPALGRQQKEMAWQELITPQQLLAQLSAEWNIDIAGELPHDLMHAGRMPQPTHLATQLILACGGFGLEPKLIAPGRFELQPLDNESSWAASYPKAQLRTQDFPRLQRLFPGSQLRINGQAAELTGDTDLHIAMLPLQTARTAREPGRKGEQGKVTVWSFAIEKAPTEAIIANLASGIGLEVVWNEACRPEHKSQLLSLKVDQAELDELLTQVCAAGGLRFSREGKRVELFPK
jgi:hypothetical protein